MRLEHTSAGCYCDLYQFPPEIIRGWFWALLLAPDLGALGYLGGPKLGAWTYNLAHHKGTAVGLYLLGIYMESQGLQLAGVMIFGHASLDRVFGYGLKYPDSFQHTHLGRIGQARGERS